MRIIYHGFDINLTAPGIIAIIGFIKWLISRHDKKKKNAPTSQQA